MRFRSSRRRYQQYRQRRAKSPLGLAKMQCPRVVAWQDAVFELYLAEEKIEPEVIENMRTWPHSGFSVDPSVLLAAGDQAGIERLVGYMTRCPFSLSRLVKVTTCRRATPICLGTPI